LSQPLVVVGVAAWPVSAHGQQSTELPTIGTTRTSDNGSASAALSGRSGHQTRLVRAAPIDSTLPGLRGIHETMEHAIKREKQIKKWRRASKLELVERLSQR
jgi:hypothetical protein